MLELAPSVRRTVFANGLVLLTEAMTDTYSVAAGLYLQVGSQHEKPAQAGISHLIEHMLFKGTKRHSAKALAQIIDAVGGRTNAYTSKEHTLYHVTVTAEHCEFAFDFLSDIVFQSLIPPKDLELEKNVVLEEIKMSEDAAEEYVADLVEQALWPKHPLGRFVIGGPKTVAKFSRKDLQDYMYRYYQPHNMVLAVSGCIDHDQVLAWVKKYFKPHVQRVPKRVASQKLPQLRASSGYTFIKRDTEQCNLCLAYPMTGYMHPRWAAQQVLNTLLGGAMSSRLFQEVREKRGLAYAVGSYPNYYRHTGALTVFAGTSPKTARKTVEVILRELQRVVDKPMSSGELTNIREKIKGSTYLGYETAEAHMGWLGRCEMLDNTFMPILKVIDQLNKVTAADVQAEAKRIFSQAPALALIGPFTEAAPLKDLIHV